MKPDYQKLEEVTRNLEEDLTEDELFHLILVAIDQKPGGLIMDPDKESENKIEKEFARISLDHRSLGDRDRGLVDKLLRRDNPFATRGLFFAKDRSRFEILEESEGDFYGCSDKAVGKFLGYPDDAVSYYTNNQEVGMETIEKIKDRFGDELDLQYLNLVGFIPAPQEEKVEKAVERGKKRERILEELKAEESFSCGVEVKEKLMEKNLWA